MALVEKKGKKPPQAQTHLPPKPYNLPPSYYAPPPYLPSVYPPHLPYPLPDCSCGGDDGNLQHFGKLCYSCWLKQQPYGGFGIGNIGPPPPTSGYGSSGNGGNSSNYGSSGSSGTVLNHYDPYWTIPDHRRFCYGWYDEDEEEGDHGSSPAGNPFKGTVTAPPIPKARPHREEETKRKPNVFNKFLRTVQHLQKIESFIVASEVDGRRFAFVNLDAGMASQLVTIKLLQRLNSRFGELYTEENVAISGIHTHAGPGGYLQYLVYSITSLGFVQQSFDAIVDAIERSIVQAHRSLKPGAIFINKGDVENAGINRSPSAYLMNPEEERARYGANVDTEMTLLKLVDGASGQSLGAFSWFPTHGTSMSRDNKLISGDNKGAAARFFEDWATSTLNNNITSSSKRTSDLNFTDIEVELDEKHMVKTCPAALGPGFAAGTTDGPGVFGFQQGDTEINELWRKLRDTLRKPSDFQVACQKPKTVLLDTGEMFQPYAWAPAILPIQILRLGKLIILSVPGEFTTMAGRRLREAVKETLISNGNGEFDDDTHVVIAGLTNTYSQYVATFEEYEQQRYEAASTLYGPHTLSAYIQEFKKLAKAIAKGENIAKPIVSPPDLSSVQLRLVLDPIGESPRNGINFGDIQQDIKLPETGWFKRGEKQKPTATFWSANPRFDLLTEGTYAVVERLEKERWTSVYDDDDFSLFFKWTLDNNTFINSLATIEWDIPIDANPGVYRLRHFGSSKTSTNSTNIYFTGASRAFAVS
ncbi:neutral ceramidase 2-like [Momordica charantia]|uniref:Neutral ceramidase n=1 Tax=Momordica charantia TaxID=3673 RepID=A0A6J1DEP5_MOMCH|nr:neutral ceramidase 2-like [Momordica charantia]